jgi:DNA-directed RNA polymerase specialized sigma24 family protein
MTTESENLTSLREAVECARKRDSRGYVINLAGSHALDGITRTLEAKWPQVDGSIVEAAVAEAADALYDALASGRTIAVPAGFLWRTAHNKLLKRHAAGLSVSEPFDESIGEHNRVDNAVTDGPDRETMRGEAIRLARSLLPTLGQTTVLQVMSVIIDCLERGESYVDNAFIADTLGLTKETVRKAKHRGFQRLEREARQRGITLDDDLANGSQDDDER